ncbi:BrnA antitoxin family protein [Accumulibacter sp.]|uniref:BrnA antitoxin family protein n=1 Tax=Accumulibacter sp. TaxID=2053492 RepID=UPI00261E452E|nr:BrnA antitoxin family protein [Accumulibacter sp.]
MTRATTTAPSAFTKERTGSGTAGAPDRLHGTECRYDSRDPAAAPRATGEARLPGRRGPQKRPTKVAVTLRYSREVLEYFKATGEGWQTRMNEALREYVERHRTA